jgi:hypothetical protein
MGVCDGEMGGVMERVAWGGEMNSVMERVAWGGEMGVAMARDVCGGEVGVAMARDACGGEVGVAMARDVCGGEVGGVMERSRGAGRWAARSRRACASCVGDGQRDGWRDPRRARAAGRWAARCKYDRVRRRCDARPAGLAANAHSAVGRAKAGGARCTIHAAPLELKAPVLMLTYTNTASSGARKRAMANALRGLRVAVYMVSRMGSYP